ncbi:unnamed protein product [Dibothriocephalus latus]|uniref:VIT domain-containing protein n=1 Tax=Dibothriocephalus latus TaxID=60516 RepID=A0A3P6V3Y2_DIBLA|nr:unnamed protein product [Dibothriocephalus latus]
MAKETYQEAVDAGQTAFYMEEDEFMGDTFTMKVGNIPPTETAVIELRFFCQLQAQEITDDSGNHTVAIFALPSVLNPRYTPEASESQRQFGPPNEIPFCKVNVPYTFSFSASLTSQSSIMGVTSAKDTFQLKYQGEEKKAAKMTLQSDFKFDHDLEMEIVFADPTKLMVTYEEGDSKAGSGILTLDCLTVNFLPTFEEGTDARNEVIFLIDRSVFVMSSNWPRPRDYTEASMEAALEYQKNTTADMGGTEVLGALKSIYAKKITGSDWHRKIIFLTDGDITNQPEVIMSYSLVSYIPVFAVHYLKWRLCTDFPSDQA